jgi:nucleolar protein 15
MDGDEAADSDGGVKVPQVEPAQASDEPAKKKAKKSKKNKKSKDGEPLTADGVNGVIEHMGEEELETATTHRPVSTSLQAEAERTVDHELEDGFGGFASEDDEDGEKVEAEDNAAALLAGFDSDTEDRQEDEGLDVSKIPSLPQSKKLQKKLEKARAKGVDEGPGTVYVGRIPHGFYEKEMRAYFSQFGDIAQLRLSRNKKTGASKHFAFIEFAHDSVAKIAAEAMDNYLMFGHILKCKYAEPGSLHPDVWKGANKKFRKIPHEKLERERLAAPKTEEQWQKKVDKEQRKRDKKAEKMKAIGLEMPASTLTSPSATLKQRLAEQDAQKQIEEEKTAPAGAIEPPADVPKDEVAVKEGKRSKKEKKSKKENKDESAAVPGSEPSGEASVLNAEAKKEKKSKKEKRDGLEAVAHSEPAVESSVTKGESRREKRGKKGKKNESAAVPIPEPAKTSTKVAAKNEAEPMDVEDEPQPQADEVNAPATTGDAASNDAATDSKESRLTRAEKKKLTKAEKKALNADRKALQAEKKALQKAQKSANKPTDAPEPADIGAADDQAEEGPVPEPDASAELSADFISLGQFDDKEGKPGQSPNGARSLKPWKIKKPKKERKNLVKARGPKSKLVATKPKPDPNAKSKIPGLPVMGKGKYDKATRNAYKELKKKIVADRAARGLPPHRVRGETRD